MTREITVGKRSIGDGEPIFIIAEMAQSHEGDLKTAKKMVDAAVNAGADAVQFQVLSVEDYITPLHPVYELVQKLEMGPGEWEELFAYTNEKKILISSAAYDVPSVDLVDRLGTHMYKIHSSDLSNPRVMERVASKGKALTIGTGASTIEEIKKGIQVSKDAGNENIILMHGYQAFPTSVDDANLRFISFLRKEFNYPVGYQDHTDGDSELAIILPLVSMPFGVNVLEKHFTLDRSKKGIDHESALNPDEFSNFVKQVRAIEAAMGADGEHEFSEKEAQYRKDAKKSIVASEDLEAGHVLTEKDVWFMRSLPGLAPSEVDQLLGKKTKQRVKKFENIVLEDVK